MRAVREMRKLLPGLQGFGRALTGDQTLRVVMTAGTPCTDGNTVFMHPPAELGDVLTHDRSVCGERDEDSVQKCAACRAHENVMIVLYHELSHIRADSFQTVTPEDRAELVTRALTEVGVSEEATCPRCSAHRDENEPHADDCDYVPPTRAGKLKARLDAQPVKHYLEAAQIVSPYLPMLLNALEDARVNAEMYRARPGTKSMFRALNIETFKKGIERPDGTRGLWSEMKPNAQVVVGCYAVASGLDVTGYFNPEVEQALQDPELVSMLSRIESARDVGTIYRSAFPVLENLRKHGFCKAKEDPKDDARPPEPTPSEEPSDDESAGESESGPTPSEDQSGAGSSEGTPDASSIPEDDDEDSTPTSAPEPTDDATGSDDAADGNDDPTADPEPTADGTDAGSDEHDDAADGIDEQDPDDSDDSDFDIDTMSEEELDGGINESHEDQDDEVGDGTADIGDADFENDQPAEESHDLEDGEDSEYDDPNLDYEDLYDDDDDEESDDLTEDSMGQGHGAKMTSAPGVPEEDDPEPEDDYDYDSMGSPDDLQEMLDKFTGHDDMPQSPEEYQEGSREDADPEVKRAINQNEYFDAPSMEVSALYVTRTYDDLPDNAYGPGKMQFGYASEEMKRDYRYIDHYNLEVSIPPENILAPALQTLRSVFTENKRAKHETNLKSGHVNTRVLGRRVPVQDPRLFQKRVRPGKRDHFVVIGLDISSSTASNGAIKVLKASAMAMAELMNRLGVKCAVYAHTGTYRPQDRASGLGGMSVEIIEVKSERDPWDANAKQRLADLIPGGGNIDSHSLEFYRKQAQKSGATDRTIMYFTDGELHDAEDVLLREINLCKREDIGVVGIGVGTNSPEQFGLETIVIDDVSDVPRVVKDLQRRLSR